MTVLAVALWHPKRESNVGSAYRSCHIYDVDLIELVGSRFKYQASDTTKASRHIPLLITDELIIPHDCVPVAVEITRWSIPLPKFNHPKNAIYIFGPEDGSLPDNILDQAAHAVVIPGRFCLNLACAVSTVLYARAAYTGWDVEPPIKEEK